MIASCMIFLASFGVASDINETTLTKFILCRENIPTDMLEVVEAQEHMHNATEPEEDEENDD